jgi:demethylspheroidene O-methyltransferase
LSQADGDGEKLLLSLLDGFIQSKLLMTAFRLDLFTLLADRPLARPEILARLGLPDRAGGVLVDGCRALGLLEERDGGLVTAPGVAPLLVRGADRPFRLATYLIEYYEALYRDLDEMAELVRTDGRSSRFKLRDYFKENVDEIDRELAASYSAYMDATVAKIAPVVLEAYSFREHRELVDLCGGTGVFCAAILRAHPHLRGRVLDVPAVAELGRRQVPSDVSARMDVVGGDVFRDDLPPGTDVVTMCRSAHDWDDARIGQLFARVRGQLGPGGRLLIIERMLPERFDPAARSLYLRSVYFLAKSTTACYRPPSRYHELLRAAGFDRVETVVPERDPYHFFQHMRIVVASCT